MSDLSRFLVEPRKSIREVMANIGHAKGLALVVDENRRLLGTVTDGDIRRAILAGVDLDQPAGELLHRWKAPEHVKPLTAPVGTPHARLLQMMSEAELHHIPLINDSGQVEDVAVLDEMVKDYQLPLTAVIMAGGYGTRLRPLTEDIPKPMLPVGGRPLLEYIVDQLRSAGIRRIEIATHYRGELIRQHFADGRKFGVEIRYMDEGEPLGTAGALSLRESSDEPVLVINGDILTKVDMRAMLDFHQQHRADMTVAVREQQFGIPFGVVQIEGVLVKGVTEKPSVNYLINAGIYLLGQEAIRRVPSGRRYDMTDLIKDLVSDRFKVIGFPIQEYWMDVGQSKDYDKAQADSEQNQETT